MNTLLIMLFILAGFWVCSFIVIGVGVKYENQDIIFAAENVCATLGGLLAIASIITYLLYNLFPL